jgi:hypothetical protein
MEKTQQEIRCSICKRPVALRQEFYVDQRGEAVHTDCYVKPISQDKNRFSGPAA